jgi:hypothetical protein
VNKEVAMSVALSCPAAARLLTALACLLLCSCAAGTSPPKAPAEVHAEMGCAQAVPDYTRTIEQAKNPSQLAQAYYYRAECLASEGRPREAYADYYAARAIGCYSQRQGPSLSSGPRPSGGDLVMSILCRQAGPDKLEQTGGRLTAAERDAARQSVEARLPAEYFAPGPD